MAADLSFFPRTLPLKFLSQLREYHPSCNSAICHPKANPIKLTTFIHACNWKAAQYNKWRHKAVTDGFDDGRGFESASTTGVGSQMDVDKVLAVAEVLCIAPSLVLSVGIAVQSTFQKSQNVNSVTSTVPVNRYANMYITWQIVPLLGALIIGAIIRTRQWQAITRAPKEFGKVGGSDFALVQRVKKLEEDVGSTVTIIRVLSRQLEKLGVRFRVTRQTLRDPINKTATLAQKTSEAVRLLAMQEDTLEMEIREIQHILLAMQEQQQKQLELLLALVKVGRLQEKAALSPVQGTEKPDDSQAYSGTKLSKLKSIEANGGISDTRHLHGASRKSDMSKSPKPNSRGNNELNSTESQIPPFTARAEMNLPQIPEGTVQDIRSKSDFAVSNSQEKDEFRSNTKEKSSG